MTEIGIMSDLHLQLGKRSNYVDYIYRSIDYFLAECKKRGIAMIFILGDVVEYKDKIDIFVLTSMLDYFRSRGDDFDFFFLVGNHETIRRVDNEVNFLKVFEKEFHVYKDYENFVIKNTDIKIHMMPYFKDDILKRKILDIEIDNKKKNYLFTHLSFKNFDVGGGHEDVWSEMESEEIESIGFDHVFSGHYHKHQTIGKTTYISSPMMTNFGEMGEEDKHGFIIANLTKNSFEFLPNPYIIKYKKYELSKENLPLILKEKNCFMEITLTKNYDHTFKENLRDKLEKTNYKIQFVYNISSNNQSVAKIDDWTNILSESKEEIVDKFVSSKPIDDIIKKELMEYIKQ